MPITINLTTTMTKNGMSKIGYYIFYFGRFIPKTMKYYVLY